MRHWSEQMHKKAEFELEPTLIDGQGNTIVYDEDGTYSLEVDGEIYSDLSALDVSFYLQISGHADSAFA